MERSQPVRNSFMSVALALYYLSRRVQGVQALPFPNTEGNTTSTCDDINNCRTTSDVVWSCITTVFTCTWVAIHPNIPAPYESSFEIGLRRFGIVIMALIAPELVIMWAMRQWLASRRFAREYQSKGWTQTHGFFALMGGFMVIDSEGRELRVLLPSKLDELSKAGKIEFPKITKKQIEDRSKGDAISKGFVIFQTGWFVLQCIARGVERLSITELELVTLAFAVLNLATYALWWNKPQNVQCSVPVHFSDASSSHIIGKGEVGEVPQIFERARRGITDVWKELGGSSNGVRGLFFNGARGLFMLVIPFIFMGFSTTDTENGIGMAVAKKVPTFYAGENKFEGWTSGLASGAIGVIFGALHCIAWSFQFPTSEKQVLWRVCSVAITCIPVSMVLLVELRDYPGKFREGHGPASRAIVRKFSEGLLFLVTLSLSITYIVSRAVLLIEAYILLKSLPPGALRTVQWTNFIPHV